MKEDLAGHYHLVQPDLSHDDLGDLSANTKTATNATGSNCSELSTTPRNVACRWNYVLDYFGDRGSISEECGRCDVCEPVAGVL